MSAPNYCVCYFSWFFEIQVPSDTHFFPKNTTVLEAKMKMAQSFEINPADITNIYLVPLSAVINFMEQIKRDPAEVKRILRDECTNVTNQPTVIPEGYSFTNAFLFFDLAGSPVTVLHNFTMNYDVKSYHVVNSTDDEEITIKLAKDFSMPRDYITLKDVSGTKICSIFPESSKTFLSGFCEFKFYLMIAGFLTLLSDVVGDVTVALSFYQSQDYYFMYMVLFFKFLSLIIRTIQMGTADYEYNTNVAIKSFFARLFICFFHLDIIIEQYARWKRCDRLPSVNARVQGFIRTLPCFCIKVYAIYFCKRFTLIFLVSSLISLYSLASLYLHPIMSSYPLLRITFFTPKRAEKSLYKYSRLVWNFLDAYWQLVLMIIFAISTRPWGVLIFYLYMVCYRVTVTPEGKYLAFVSGLMDTLFIRRYHFLFNGNVELGYLEESEEFIHNDYYTVVAEVTLRFVKAVACIGATLYYNADLRHISQYDNPSVVMFWSAVAVLILVFVKYLHDVNVIDDIMRKVFYFRGEEIKDHEDDDIGSIQLEKMRVLREATQIDDANSERERVNEIKTYMNGNQEQNREALLGNA